MIVPKKEILRPDKRFEVHEKPAVHVVNRRAWIGVPYVSSLLTLPDTNGVYRMFNSVYDKKKNLYTYQVVVYGQPVEKPYEY